LAHFIGHGIHQAIGMAPIKVRAIHEQCLGVIVTLQLLHRPFPQCGRVQQGLGEVVSRGIRQTAVGQRGIALYDPFWEKMPMTSHLIFCQSKHGHVVDQHPVHALNGRPGHQRQDSEAAEGIVPGMAEEHVEEGGEDDRVETLEFT
jgi:hypothetical protein